MTSHDAHEHPVANPERTVLDADAEQDKKNNHDKHDQQWPEVAEEVKEAVDNADGPLG